MESSGLAYIRHIPELALLLERADHVDVKTVTSSVDLHTFLASMLSYRPGWVTLLYHMVLNIHTRDLHTSRASVKKKKAVK